MKILVVGAGALGCEILKNLLCSNVAICSIDIIDFDLIEITNLNRQFLYNEEDIGLSKAKIASERLSVLFPYASRIEQMPIGYFDNFDTIISAVDSLSTRLWLSSTIHVLNNCKNLIFIDCGVEGLYGHVFSTKINMGPCLGCISKLYASRPVDVAYCTIKKSSASVNGTILWALYVAWDEETPFGESTEFNIKNSHHVNWIIDRCRKRSNLFSELELRSELFSVQILSPSPISMVTSIGGMVALHLMNILNSSHVSTFTFLSLRNVLYLHSFCPEALSDCNICSNKVVSS